MGRRPRRVDGLVATVTPEARARPYQQTLNLAGEAFLPAVPQMCLLSHFYKWLGPLMTTEDALAPPLLAVRTNGPVQAHDLFFPQTGFISTRL